MFFFLSSASIAIECFAEYANANETAAPDAREVFSRLDEYLKNNALRFTTSYKAENIALGSSQGAAHFYVARPNLLRIELAGAGFSYVMTSDGKIFTIYDEKSRKYAQRPATERPIEAVNLFTGLAAFQARVLQFLGLVDDIAGGDSDLVVTKAGVDRVGDLECVRYDIQYSSRADSDKWTAWLRQDGVPLPCKTSIQSSDEGNQQTNLYVWDSKAVQSGMYSFVPPSGSTEVSISDLALRPLQ
jgi:hypothetical protein